MACSSCHVNVIILLFCIVDVFQGLEIFSMFSIFPWLSFHINLFSCTFNEITLIQGRAHTLSNVLRMRVVATVMTETQPTSNNCVVVPT